MIRQTSQRKRFVIFLIFSLLFVILIPVVILYSTGYRLGKNLELMPTGGIYVYYPQAGVTVTVQGLTPQTTSIFAKSVLIQNLNPDQKYEVTVTKDGYADWHKKVLVLDKRVAEAYPFLVLNPLATTTLQAEIRPSITLLFASSTATTTSTSILLATSTAKNSNDMDLGGIEWKNIYLYTDKTKNDKELVALWKGETGDTPFYFCSEKTELCDSGELVTRSASPIKHFDFYPGRNDVVIYSNDDGVFITELDKRSPDNWATLAKGKVDFRVLNGHIYIKDKTTIYEVIYEQ